MGKNVYTPPTEDCPDCDELINSKCVIEEDSLPGIGMAAGSTASSIFGKISSKIQQVFRDLKKAIFDVTPIYEVGIDIMNYSEGSCNAEPSSLKIPLFLNGKFCFEYDEDTTVTYTDEDSYFLFFNYTHCSPIFTSVDDTVQILAISGQALTTPIVVKQPGSTGFSISDADRVILLDEINTLTGSTFLDIVIDDSTSVANDLGLGLVLDTGAGATFLGDLTFDYEVLDAGLVQINLINETITQRQVTGVGIPDTITVPFSVDSMGGVYTFFDEVGDEITEEASITVLTDLLLNQEARNVCCPDCSNLETVFEYTGADVDCGALNLATAGDTLADILDKVCIRIGTIGDFFNVFAPNDDGDVENVFINGSANSTAIDGDVAFWLDRVGYSGDVTIDISSVDGIEFSIGTQITIPADNSITFIDITHPTGLAPGNYTATFTWTGGALVKVQNITFVLS